MPRFGLHRKTRVPRTETAAAGPPIPDFAPGGGGSAVPEPPPSRPGAPEQPLSHRGAPEQPPARRGTPDPPPSHQGAPDPPPDLDSAFAELSTVAPRVGHVPGQVVPRLAPLTTGLPSVRVDAGLLGGRWLAAASTTGLGHLREGTTGQDVYRYAVADDGSALVLAVCDGLGSRPTTSQIGSALLAAYACEALAAVGPDRLAAGAEAALREALVGANFRAQHYRNDVEPDLSDRDLACTVLLCLLPLAGPGDTEDRPAHFLRVGDGNAFTLSGDTYTEIFRHGDGPANIVLASLPHPAPESLIEYTEFPLDGVDAVLLATDGLATDVFDSSAVRRWLASSWQRPCGPARMLDTLRYRRQGSHDDRTALVAWSTRLSAAANSAAAGIRTPAAAAPDPAAAGSGTQAAAGPVPCPGGSG